MLTVLIQAALPKRLLRTYYQDRQQQVQIEKVHTRTKPLQSSWGAEKMPTAPAQRSSVEKPGSRVPHVARGDHAAGSDLVHHSTRSLAGETKRKHLIVSYPLDHYASRTAEGGEGVKCGERVASRDQ